ncbi:MAG: UbiA family prenyltransferase [Candidatus Diapherotrites archaeon]|nr:UbiA family prenyltransferase [Candidatus Diapherotrites archaeon]
MAIKDYLIIMRPVNALMAAIGVLIGFFVGIGYYGVNLNVILAMISVIFISGAGQVINDYYDYEIDKKAKTKRPVASGKISRKNAHYFAIALFATGTLIAVFINLYVLVIAMAMSILFYSYSAFIQKRKYFGNAVVALGTAMTFIYGGAVAMNFTIPIMLAIPAFFANLGREVSKDIEDLAKDKGVKKTLPMLIGPQNAGYMSFIWSLFAIGTGYIVIYVLGTLYALFYVISIPVFAYAGITAITGKPSKSQKFYKVAMLVILIGFLLGNVTFGTI